MRYIKIRPEGFNAITIEPKDFVDYINDSDIGEKWEVEVVEMTESKFNSLPEGGF